jgi:hypothetical protein
VGCVNSNKNATYDYTDYYIDDDGYYIVEGVRVLPDDDPACAEEDDNHSYSSLLFSRIFGNSRHLGEEGNEMIMDEEESHRALMGMMGMMSSSGYSDDYYFVGKGKVSY